MAGDRWLCEENDRRIHQRYGKMIGEDGGKYRKRH